MSYTIVPFGRRSIVVGPISGVSNVNENRTCLAEQNQDQKTRGEGEIEISGVLSINPLRIRSDADCRTQHGVNSEHGNANYADSQYIDHPVSFTVLEAHTEEEAS